MEGLNMKKSIYAIILTAFLGTVLLSGCSQNNSTAKSGTEISPAAQTNAGITNSPTGAGASPAAQTDISVTNPPVSQTDDKDGDGIPDTVEKTYGTNPYSADSDGDGINDIVIGAHYDYTLSSRIRAGGVYVIFGAAVRPEGPSCLETQRLVSRYTVLWSTTTWDMLYQQVMSTMMELMILSWAHIKLIG
jgi:hypothetical protein